jgi:hypothetical protein
MAICFEVRINDDPPTVAGLDDLAVLTAMLTSVPAHGELDVRVGGLRVSDAGREHVEWLQRALAPGDEVRIHVVEASEFTPPVRREAADGRA